jgi:LAO/AO transport system ATPase
MSQSSSLSQIELLVEQLQAGSRGALARLLTLAASDRSAAEIAATVSKLATKSAPVIAITGSGGVGKSSLLGAIVAQFAAQGERIGVLACDPQSAVTGGALLGDRCRIAGNADSGRVFIRSVPAASGQQGLTQNITLMLQLLQAYAFDRIFVETAGTGQGDIAVSDIANRLVLVLQPQTGDELQWEKAGILEIADIVVINKSDLPGSEQTMAEVEQQLQARDVNQVAVLATSVARNQGIDALCRVLGPTE